MKWNWQLTVAFIFFVSLFGGILFIGHLSSPLGEKSERDLASVIGRESKKIMQVQRNRHQQDGNNSTPMRKEREDFYQEYFQDSSQFEIREISYQVSANLRAAYQEVVDIHQLNIVFKKNGLIFYQPEEISYAADVQMPVVYDANRKVLGVVTGKLMIKLLNEQDFDMLRLSYGLEHYYHAKSINVHYFVVPKGVDPFETFEEVSNLNFVEKAELEIIEDVPQIK